MHRISKREQQKLGGKLARALGMKLDPKTRKWVVGMGLASSEAVYEVAHEVVCCVRETSDTAGLLAMTEGK